MLCRLCLTESKDYLQIYSDAGEVMEALAVAVIAKYFLIEMQKEDFVSNKICTSCWKHLNDFHVFCTDILEKQKLLIENIEQNRVIIKEDPRSDNEDATLCEPEIYISAEGNIIDSPELDVKGFGKSQLIIPPDPVKDIDLKTRMKDKAIGKRLTRVTKKNRKRESTDLQSSKTAKVSYKEGLATETEINDDSALNSPHSTNIMSQNNTDSHKSRKRMIQQMDEYIAENTQLTCCICAVPLHDFQHLHKHFRQEHQCVGYVLCCENRFKKRRLYFDHLRVHNDVEYFKCSVCGNTFSSRQCLKHHMVAMHPQDDALQFQCSLCIRKFSKQYILDEHIKSVHNTDRNYKCGECEKSFKNKWMLNQHLKAVHVAESQWVCDVCGKQMKTAQNLALHIEAIHNNSHQPEVQCEVCLKWIKNLRCLSNHMIIHRDEASGKEYKCKHCDATKSSRRALTTHERLHHSSKIFKCTICGKEFKRNRSLEEHVATHTGKPLYKCPFCPKTFKSDGNMHKHKTNKHSTEWIRKRTQPSQQTLEILTETQPTETSESQLIADR